MLLHLAQDEGEEGHSHDHAVERLYPVAGVAGEVHVQGQLVLPRQRVENDGFGPKTFKSECEPAALSPIASSLWFGNGLSFKL